MKNKTESCYPLAESITQIRSGLNLLENFAQGFEGAGLIEARWLIHTCDTGRFLLDMHSLVDRSIRNTDGWEPLQIEMLLKLVRKYYTSNYDLVFLDVGSYIGWYALSLLKSGLFAEIHAFEANPENFAQLNANIMLNDALKAVHAHHVVVSDEPGKTPLRLPLRRSNRGWAEVGELGGFAPDFEVKNAVLDKMFSDAKGRFIVVKIDVEGHEERVLSGMIQLVASNAVIMQIELYEKNRSQTLNRLKSLGFELIDQVQEDFFLVKT